MDIHTNQEYAELGYSGVFQYEVEHRGFRVSINRGSTNSGAHDRINACTATVRRGRTEMFTFYVYQGNDLYPTLTKLTDKDLEKPEVKDMVVSGVIDAAVMYIAPTKLLAYLIDVAETYAKAKGKAEIQSVIRAALGISDES